MSKRLVNNATADNRQNTQGSLLRELSQKSNQSIEDCHKLEDLLVARLKKNKPNTL